MKSAGIFLISKNNYDFLDKYWEKNFPYEGFEVLNIDEGSSPEEQEKGKAICEKYGFTYMDRKTPGLHSNVELGCKYFKEKGVKFLTWWQHDCWPQEKDFMDDFEDLVNTGKLDDFGTVGFNGFATDVNRNYDMRKMTYPIGILGRGCLTKRQWYLGTKS